MQHFICSIVILATLIECRSIDVVSPSKVGVNTRNSTLWTGKECETDLIDLENIRFADDLRIVKWTQIFYCLKHTRFSRLSIPIKFHYITHYYLLLFVCGDISLNPGPVKNPCGKCSRPVAKNHWGLQSRYVTMKALLNLMLTFLTNYVQLERNFPAHSCVYISI